MIEPKYVVFIFLCVIYFDIGAGEIFRKSDLNETDFAKCRREDFQYWNRQDKICHNHSYEIQRVHSCSDDEVPCRRMALIRKKCSPRYFPDECHDRQQNILPCRHNEFTCSKSRRCLPRWSVHDNEVDCNTMETQDDSDEIVGPYNYCEENEFRCNRSGRCIPRSWVMDGFDDCSGKGNATDHDTSDENKPLQYCNETYEFACPDSLRCIPRYRVKDDYSDCVDGHDEKEAFDSCNNEEFRCNDTGRCIPRSWVKDGIENCKNRVDEQIGLLFSCNEKEFSCQNGRRCIPVLYLCDGVDHCGDCSDEVEACDEARMWRCPNDRSICVLQSHGCDGYPDCPGYADTMSFTPGFKCYVEASRVYCAIPQWSLHDDLSTCTDRSDVCFGPHSFNCSFCGDRKTIIAKNQVCDGLVDCTDVLDECLCLGNAKARTLDVLCESICIEDGSAPCQHCSRGSIYCNGDKKCISQKQLCDNVVDCPSSRLDEKFCDAESARPRNYTCQEIGGEVLKGLKCSCGGAYLESLRPKYARQCDGIMECYLFDDECSPECSNPMSQCDMFPLRQKGNDSYRVSPYRSKMMPGTFVCNGATSNVKNRDEDNCTKRHYCNTSKTLRTAFSDRKLISIREEETCDGVIDCLDSSDEMNCSTDTHFYCCSGSPLFVSATTDVKNGIKDCSDNSDECPLFSCDGTHVSVFGSREEMISWPFLRYLIWVMAFVALFGNISVILELCYYSFIMATPESQAGKCNRMLLCSLAVSDLLMGVVLFTLGIKSKQLSGKYCQNEDIWETSTLCNGVGALSVVSSQTSVYTLVLLTFYRLYGARRPFKSQRLKLKKVFGLILFGWASSCFIAVVPFVRAFGHTFISHALITPSPYFFSTKVSWADLHKFAVRSVVLSNVSRISPDDLNSWSAVERIFEIEELRNFTPRVSGYFGHYSTDGVCIPRMFRLSLAQNVPPLALFTITTNFVSLLFIFVSYCVIYKSSTSGAERLNVSITKAREQQNKLLQRKIAILVGTYACCWVPICIMCFLSTAGVILSNEVYAVSAIVLMPINSSVNPFIYSNGFQLARRKLRKWWHAGWYQQKSPQTRGDLSQQAAINTSL